MRTPAAAPRRTRLSVVLLAVAGMVAGHVLAYRLASADPAVRGDLLAESGHRYWSWVVVAALVSAVSGLVDFAVCRWRSARVGSPPSRLWFSPLARRLVGLQVAGFLVLEGAERTFTGHSPASLLDPAIAVGVVVQVLVALGMSLALLMVSRTVERLRSSRPVTGGVTLRLRRPHPLFVKPPAAPGAGGATMRGPPPVLRSAV